MTTPRRTPTARARVALAFALALVAALQPVAHAAASKPGPIGRLAARQISHVSRLAPEAAVRPSPGRLGATRAIGTRLAGARPEAPTVVAAIRTALRDTLVLGPRHTLHALKRNPKAFAAGLLAIGGVGAATEALGLHGGHYVAVGISGLTLAVQLFSMWSELRTSRGLQRASVFGSEVLWPLGLFAATTAAGAALDAATAAAAAGPTLYSVVGAFFASLIIGVDAPAVGVTALDNLSHRDR